MRSMAARVVVGLTIAGAMAVAWSPMVNAATATENLAVGAAVANNCTITTTALAFGSYDPVVANAAANLDGGGTVTIACTRGATTTIGLGLGANASGNTRRMSDGAGNVLQYELYQDSNRSAVWGNANPDWFTLAAAPSRAARNFTVYGRVPANQDVPAGTYSDTVVATVNF